MTQFSPGIPSAYQFAALTVTADLEMVAAIAGRRIRVHALVINFFEPVNNVTVKSGGATGTVLFGSVDYSTPTEGSAATAADVDVFAGPNKIDLQWSPVGWFESAVGENLYLDQVGTTGDGGGCIVYSIV